MFDLDTLRSAVAAHGAVARVVIAEVAGSSPRETGAAMLVWAGGQSGTIGGGALEWQATSRASAMLETDKQQQLDVEPLGPKLGQCCGGMVTLLTETFDAATLAALPDDIFARPVSAKDMPLAVSRLLAQARSQGVPPPSGMVQGWMVEPVAKPARQIWIWGAGHVGRAIVDVLAPLPDLAITWVDVDAARFPDRIPEGVTTIPTAQPAVLAAHAPTGAEHLILTYSHALDLALCHATLTRGFARCGLIGSKTKWARFRARLTALGHSPAAITRIDCPIGDPALGKHPQMIAIGVASSLLKYKQHASRQENAG
ncbi:xanthine dehydrogenase accessory protein XdhC (plasmid) [Pseudorhodobacter turbinis]|uniref:Xanthine dehydrogenase accessory protein XdhC n=1 Tax=Pseudorhodobacter turbinis TaxID=2500533 RepID=A0A4P8EK58_9RHOB|nr:xanthine dehydrogenase accessory protein XdhC [Pseudorhodobacter turbinis]QCO57427.1 xanthine dehydrogenase accessory protein XdhC [Pseudorhodobacter turbinis]